MWVKLVVLSVGSRNQLLKAMILNNNTLPVDKHFQGVTLT